MVDASAMSTDNRIKLTQEQQSKPARPPPDSNKLRKTRRGRNAASSGMTPSLGESLKDDLGINPPPLSTVSGGMTQLSDDYLQGLSIDSGGTPNFFHDKSLNDDTHTVNMGVGQGRGWGTNLGSMLLATRSTESGRSGGSSGGKSPGYFNNNELSELFSIVRGKPIFGASGTHRRQTPVAPRSAAPTKSQANQAVTVSPFEQLAALPEQLRALPPIRTKSMEPQTAHVPGSSGRFFSGLTPHASGGSGLTPTGLTPGSIAGFPGVDHFGMNLTEGHQGGLVPGMPGWASASQQAQGANEEPVSAVGAKAIKAIIKRKSEDSMEDIRPSKTSKLTEKNGSTGKGGSKKSRGKPPDDRPDDVDDIPLSGLVKGSSVAGAAIAAAAAAAKLGIPLPGAADGVTNDEDDYEIDEEAGEKPSSTKSRSRSWLPSEDELVRALVAQHGPRKWTLIASRLKTKTQKQVYARWRDYLQPGLTTKPWSKEEQAKLVELQAHVGNQWAVLARLMPGRSPNAIKNRFHATKRKMERHNKREGSNLGPSGGELKVGGKTSKSTSKSSKTQRRQGHQKSGLGEEEYSKEEQMAVEGLLLADTPTSLIAHNEKDAAARQFDIANAMVEDRL